MAVHPAASVAKMQTAIQEASKEAYEVSEVARVAAEA
jgi:hypothetical protein